MLGDTHAHLHLIKFGLDWTPNVAHVSLFVAAASGAFARRGLQIEFIIPGDSLRFKLMVHVTPAPPSNPNEINSCMALPYLPLSTLL